MMATILDGKYYAEQIYQELAVRIETGRNQGRRAPCLAVVLVGEDPASQVYVRNKVNACQRLGITSLERRLEAGATQAEVETSIQTLNEDPEVDGILCQLPLPKGLDAKAALLRISPEKDVDGFHPLNQGRLLQGVSGHRPCTPSAVMAMLRHFGVKLAGKRALVLGRSEIVGKPMAFMLLEEHATVTIAHSRTQDLPALCREAEILVAAVGKPGLVEGSWIRPGAIVIDVGMNRVEDPALGELIFKMEPDKLQKMITKGGVLTGDVRYGEALDIAGAITPVPGGVGLLTVAGLMANTVNAWFVGPA